MNQKLYIVFVLAFLSVHAFGQRININKALRYFQQEKLDSAKIFIDEASQHPETSSFSETWYYKGFVYKEIYNKNKGRNDESDTRDVAINSFFKHLELDTTGRFQQSAEKSIKYLATTIYNDAVVQLNTVDYGKAIANFEKYKGIMEQIEPSTNLLEIELQFNSVLAGVYNQIYEEDNEKNHNFLDKCAETYQRVISLDPNNISANYNLGILYYNEAVNIIKNLDYDLDIITLELVQDDIVVLFKKALPYMEKAYQLNPKKEDTLTGLSGIYFSLNEFEKQERIEKELELLKKSGQDE